MTATLQPSGGTSLAYSKYLGVRDAVLRQLQEEPVVEDSARSQRLALVEYLFDATPNVVARWREHCHHLTGVQSYTYRAHHAHRAKDLQRQFRRLRILDTSELLVPEPEMLGGFGFELDGMRVNAEMLRWNEALLALDEAGWLEVLKSLDHPVVVEFGAGWGGFTQALRRHVPKMCQVLIDRPEHLLFSGTYLQSHFPDHRWLLCDSTKSSVGFRPEDYDFVLIPDFALGPCTWQPELAVSIAASETFTREAHSRFLSWLVERGCPRIYQAVRETESWKDLKSHFGPLDEAYDSRWSKRFRPRSPKSPRLSRWRRVLERLRLRSSESAKPPTKKKVALRHLFSELAEPGASITSDQC